MCAQRFFDLQCRNLVAAGLDDVDTRPSKDAVRAVFYDSGIARAEPAVAKCPTCFLRTSPVLQKHVRPPDLDFPRRSLRQRVALLIGNTHVYVGQWCSHEPRSPFTAQRIG